MSALPIIAKLDAEQARSLTEEVKRDAAALWQKLLTLYEGGAHTALGYTSWGTYFEAEFGQRKSQAYELLAAARVADSVRSSGLTMPMNAHQARELSAVAARERAEFWKAATERAEAEGPRASRSTRVEAVGTGCPLWPARAIRGHIIAPRSPAGAGDDLRRPR